MDIYGYVFGSKMFCGATENATRYRKSCEWILSNENLEIRRINIEDLAARERKETQRDYRF